MKYVLNWVRHILGHRSVQRVRMCSILIQFAPKKKKTAAEKRTMSQEITGTNCVLGVQNFVNYEQMNLIK